MACLVQIRNVPDALHRELKARAAFAGMSLSDSLLREVRQSLERPTLDEIKRRLAALPAVHLRRSPAAVIRAARNGR